MTIDPFVKSCFANLYCDFALALVVSCVLAGPEIPINLMLKTEQGALVGVTEH